MTTPVIELQVSTSESEANLPSPAIGAICSMVERRNRCHDLMEQAMSLIAQAKALAPSYTYEHALTHLKWYSDQAEVSNKELLRAALDKSCWNTLLDESKLGAVMNSNQLETARRDIDQNRPPLTQERAMATFMELYSKRADTFQEGMVEVFQRLSGRYRSHDPFKIKKRSILQNALEGAGWYSRGHKDQFNDVWHYLAVLDGEDPTAVSFDDRPSEIIAKAHRGGQREFEFPQFKIKTFECGNIHILFDHRQDLMDRVNSMIADYYGRVLPSRRHR